MINPTTWLDIAGNGAVTTLLAAAVAWVVSRANRDREAKRDWRDIRHEAFINVLDHVSEAEEASRRYLTTGQSVRELLSADPQGQLNELKRLCGQLTEDEARIALLGSDGVSAALDDFIYHLSKMIWDALNKQLSEDKSTYLDHMEDSEQWLREQMREQLGVDDDKRGLKNKIWRYVRRPRLRKSR